MERRLSRKNVWELAKLVFSTISELQNHFSVGIRNLSQEANDNSLVLIRKTNKKKGTFKSIVKPHSTTLHHFLSISLDEQWSIPGHILLQ